MMKNPFWFNIIQQWKLMGKGQYGVTFPFLMGALAHKSTEEADISSVFQLIINEPVDGFYSEVRWCGNIDEPVISIVKLEDITKAAIKAGFSAPGSDTTSLAFTEDLMSFFHLDCKTADECLSKLISYTENFVGNGQYSKQLNRQTFEREFAPFSADDIQFIEDVGALTDKT
ncbi:hypothetical protein [Vibrio parahaemolyticus]